MDPQNLFYKFPNVNHKRHREKITNGQLIQHVTQLASFFPAKFQSGRFVVSVVAVNRSHGSWALKTIRIVERREEDSDGRGGSPSKQNLVRI